jgi:hypothetical protein
MENVTFITDTNGNEHALIDRGNGEYTSMLKSTYDEMINAPTAFPHQPLVEG